MVTAAVKRKLLSKCRDGTHLCRNRANKCQCDCHRYPDKALAIDSNYALAYYNKASSLALTKNDSSLVLLEKAIRLNPSYKNLAKNDEDFVNIKHNERFKKIIESTYSTE